MKNLFVLAAVTIASTSAFASKARLNALQSAAHLSDIQDIVGHLGGAVKPDAAISSGEWATFEFGSTSGATTNAEGGFNRKMGENSALGFYLGNKSDTYSFFYGEATTAGASLLNQQNPLNIFYASKMGDMSWGLELSYASSDKKTTKQKENIMGLYASAKSAAGWDAQLGVGLGAEGKNETTPGSEVSLKGGSSMSLTGGYQMDSLYVYGAYKMAAFKLTTGSTTNKDWDKSTMTVGVVNSHKKDAADFFYGVEYSADTLKQKQGTEVKTETTSFPVIIGVEAEATSWMVLRGSLKQSLLLSSSKTTTGGNGEANTNSDDTTVAAGAGIKWNKFMVDGTVAVAGSNGAAFGTDSGHFLSQLSLTYNF